MLEKELARNQAKLYNPDNAAKISEMLVDSECGYVPYEDVVDQFGKQKTEAMIKRNILHYRQSWPGTCCRLRSSGWYRRQGFLRSEPWSGFLSRFDSVRRNYQSCPGECSHRFHGESGAV